VSPFPRTPHKQFPFREIATRLVIKDTPKPNDLIFSFYHGDQIGDEMSWVCSTYARNGKSLQTFIRKT
jgi:hypothetical protein